MVDLRGYGKVAATFAAGRARFTCESPDKAELLQGKLLADLMWDVGRDQRSGKAFEIKGNNAIVFEVPSHGAIVVGRLDGIVVALGGADANEAMELAAKEPMFREAQCRFKADKAYPIYLDFFDLSAVKAFTYSMSSVRGEGLASHWPFLRKFGITGIAYSLGGGMLMAKSPARGILNFVDTDYEVREAERNHGLIMPSISTGGGLPVWALNLFPQSIARLSPTGIGEDDHTLRPVESYGMRRDEREASGLWSLRETIRRYSASPAVGGFKLYDGTSGGEAMHGYQEVVDFSESGLRSYREYLRDVKGFDLKAVGARHYNDPNHFKSWDEVMPLDANGFFGNLDDSCLLLKEWQWQSADSQSAEPPPQSHQLWRKLLYPGSDQMHTIPEADAFYRISIDAGEWMARNAGKDMYLVCGRTRARKPIQMKIWLNGKYLGEQGEWLHNRSRPAAVRVNGTLKPGGNELTLWVPKGKLLSPFFLTTGKPEEYPASDKTLNARYVDLKDWHCHRLGARHRDMIELARGIESNRALILTAGGAWEMADDIADIASSLGTAVRNTGREDYQPWWARLGRVAGFYSSSEPGSTVTPDSSKPMSLSWMFGSILIDSDSDHTLYWQLEDYIGIERETGWFSKNKRLLSLVGKSLPPPPQIIIFRSSQTMRYCPEHWGSAPFRWDIGRGELNGAHFNWGYASEGLIARGLPNACKVLFDSGSEVMGQATVDAIAAFVSNGGTYVALHNTGMHDPLEGNVWPASRLTGCKVVGQKAKGTIRFEADLPVFKGWEGRELQGEGIALDWQGNDNAKAQSLRLSPQSGDVRVLARWADGTAAVTLRKLGKGRVLCLGSTFWRSARDQGGGNWQTAAGPRSALERILTDLGVERESDASSSAVWVSNPTTKNGLGNWLIAFNSARTPTAGDLQFRTNSKPAEVRELTSGQVVPFDYADGSVHLKGVQFDSAQTKVFAVKRANLADGLPFWWSEKATYWKKADVPQVKDEPRDAGKLGTLKIDSWKFLADRDGKVSESDAWHARQFNDSAWDTMETGPWNSLKLELKDYTGIGLYRTSFTIPAEWKGSSVSLNLYGDRAPKVFGSAEFFINGKKVEGSLFYQDLGLPSYPARIVVDKLLAGGNNVLAVKIKGGAKLGGEDFSGFGGCVYLAAEIPLSPAANLDGKWTLVRQDETSSTITFPASAASGKYVAKEFEVPASWAGREIYLRIETASPWLEGIMINGNLLLSARFRRIGRYAEWNVTPWIEPGKSARVELWTRGLPLFETVDPKKPMTDATIDLLSARFGCRD